jgi:acetyltransferase
MVFRALVAGARFRRGVFAQKRGHVTEGANEPSGGDALLPAAASAHAVDARRYCHPIQAGVHEVTVRPIDPSDADRAQAFVAGLSYASRYSRFFHALKSLSPAMLKRFVGTHQHVQVILVGLVVVQGRQIIVAEARYCVGRDGTVEIAVAVADAWQRRGIATVLLNMLERIAAANGVTQFTALSFAVNAAFLKFALAYGFRTCRDADPAYLRFQKHIDTTTCTPELGDFAMSN